MRSSVVILFFATVLVPTALAQSTHERPKSTDVQDSLSSPKQSPQTSSELAVVVIQPSKQVYAVDEGITATVSLVAGDKGVYVSRHLGVAMSSWPGFSLWLEYLDGQNAQTCLASGFVDFAGPLPSPAELFKKEFIFLKPGEERKMEMGISCPPKKPGAYRLQAAYSPSYPQTDKVAELPETHGLVLRKRIQADLVGIDIR